MAFKFRPALAGLFALALMVAPALAVTSTNVPVSSDQYYDLGAGPLQVQPTSQPVAFLVADTQPSIALAGQTSYFPTNQLFNTTSHVWAKSINASTIVVVTPSAGSPSSPGVVTGVPYAYTPLTPGQHNLAITTSTALAVPNGATYATICATGANVNYTTDGTTTPTSSVGQPILAGQCEAFSGATVLANFRAIQQTATATLNSEFFK